MIQWNIYTTMHTDSNSTTDAEEVEEESDQRDNTLISRDGKKWATEPLSAKDTCTYVPALHSSKYPRIVNFQKKK